MPRRLRRVSSSDDGWHRRRRGKGFSYVDSDGRPLGAEDIERVQSLAIPPAWTDVWICPYPNGHLQAVGTDAAGRRQYLYHPAWRERRDWEKFQRITEAAEHLPEAREQIANDLATDGFDVTRVCAAAVRLLDVGYFRIGNDFYADANGSFGLTTLERRHVRRNGEGLKFQFTGKSGISHEVLVDDPAIIETVEKLRRQRTGTDRLLVHRTGNGWRALSSEDVNGYLSSLFDGRLTAKDFRTWHGTVVAAEALALTNESGETKASRDRARREAAKLTSDYLGNTPTVARNSYIDPRIFDHYESGRTIEEAAKKLYKSPDARRDALEEAVLDLLQE